MTIKNLPNTYPNKALVEMLVERILSHENSNMINEINLATKDINKLSDTFVPITVVLNSSLHSCDDFIGISDDIEREFKSPIRVDVDFEPDDVDKFAGFVLWKRDKES